MASDSHKKTHGLVTKNSRRTKVDFYGFLDLRIYSPPSNTHHMDYYIL